MRLFILVLPALLLAACASGPKKPISCDGSNLRPINPGYPARYVPPSPSSKSSAPAPAASTAQP